MAPSEQSVAETIRITVQRMFNGPEREKLSVNSVRGQVEEELDLDAGFLKEGSWKLKSKEIIKAKLEKLQELEEAGEEPVSSQPTAAKAKAAPAKKPKSEPVKTGTKRPSNGDKAKPRKRQKKEDTPISDDEDSPLTSVEETPEDSEGSYVSDAPKAKKMKMSVTKGIPKPQQKGKFESKRQKSVGAEGNAPGKASEDSYDGKKKAADILVESDSEMSILLDEAPKPKKKVPSTTSATKSSKSSKTSKPLADLPPEEAELKTLQSQLTKCGIRKIWGVELKKYGSDTKAKIRHLKSMLKGVGIDGRFSEAKAREIKEARELMADLEAVKEGNAIWGMGRGSRSKKGNGGKRVAEESDEEEQEEKVMRGRSGSEKPPASVARAKMDLAFLGDEESDSE